MAIDEDWAFSMCQGLGVTKNLESLSGGVTFSIQTRGDQIVLGLSRECTLIELDPDVAMDLAGALSRAVKFSSRAPRESLPSAYVASRGSARTLALAIAVMAVGCLLSLACVLALS
jgi:hypothetical protein